MTQQLIVEWSSLPAPNSGVLAQPRVRVTDQQIRLSAEVVAVSAASHVAPRHDRAAEAPRIYSHQDGSPITRAEVRLTWLDWFHRRLGAPDPVDVPTAENEAENEAHRGEMTDLGCANDPSRYRSVLASLLQDAADDYPEITD